MAVWTGDEGDRSGDEDSSGDGAPIGTGGGLRGSGSEHGPECRSADLSDDSSDASVADSSADSSSSARSLGDAASSVPSGAGGRRGAARLDADSGGGDRPSRVAGMCAEVQHLVEGVSALAGDEAVRELAELAALAAVVDAWRVELVRVVNRTQVWREQDGNATPTSFLRNELGLDHRDAAADVRAATAFESYPELATAARSGLLSRDKVDVVLGVGLRTPERIAAFGDFVDTFIAMGQRLTASQLRTAMRMWADQIDPVTTTADDRSAHDRRELHVSQLGDGVKLDGFFAQDDGAKIMAVLNGALNACHRSRTRDDQARDDQVRGHEARDDDQTRGSQARDGEPTRDDRATRDDKATAGQLLAVTTSTAAQRADAFMESVINPILTAGLLPTSGGAPATVTVMVPAQRLAEPGQVATNSEVAQRLERGDLRLYSPVVRASNGPGEFLISTVTAQRLSCDATIQRVLLSPEGKPLDIGRRTRTIPDSIRTALLIRDGHCQFPYCRTPAGWAEGHHIQHWSQGGSTSLDNLILLCSRHHHVVHAENTPIKLNAQGIPRIAVPSRIRHPLRH